MANPEAVIVVGKALAEAVPGAAEQAAAVVRLMEETGFGVPGVRFGSGVSVTRDSLVGQGTILGDGVRIGDNAGCAWVGDNVKIGSGTHLYRFALAESDATLGAGVRLEASSRAGAGSYIGHGSSLGRFARVEEGAVVEPGSRVGDWQIVKSGTRVPAGTIMPDLSPPPIDLNETFLKAINSPHSVPSASTKHVFDVDYLPPLAKDGAFAV